MRVLLITLLLSTSVSAFDISDYSDDVIESCSQITKEINQLDKSVSDEYIYQLIEEERECAKHYIDIK